MNTELIIITGIIFLAALAILFGIFNWLKLSSIALKISIMEKEIEKKAKEFDALKKERQIAARQVADSMNQKAPFDDPLTLPYNSAESSNPPIEIVRNYPNGFQMVGFENKPQSEVLEIIDEDKLPIEASESDAGPVEIVLYSDAKKDTDFTAAWRNLTTHLSGGNCRRFIINLKNVMFLYEKELAYLEKMYEIVTNAHGSIKLTHFHKELENLLLSRPLLSDLIQGSKTNTP
jgi:hypothetical protein